MSKTVKIRNRNNVFQHILVLKTNREKRNRYAEFLVEGVRSINLAAQNNWEFSSFIFNAESKLSDWAKKILNQFPSAQKLEMLPELLAEIGDKQETSEILAVIKIPNRTVSNLSMQKDMTVLVLDRPGSPGNLGSTLRSCDAFGINAVIISGHATDLFDPLTVRSSTGSIFSVPVFSVASHKEVLNLRSEIIAKFGSCPILGTSEDASVDIRSFVFQRPCILVMGNETRGMSKNYSEICDQIIKIPMQGSASSLNISCAASIFLYELSKRV